MTKIKYVEISDKEFWYTLDRHLPENRCLLGEIPHSLLGPLIHRQLGDLLIVQENLSFVRNHLTCNHIETRRLAGSVRAEESYNLSLVDLHGDSFNHGADAVFLDEICAMELHIT